MKNIIVVDCLLTRSANFSYGFLRKSGHAHYNMFPLQQNPPLAFGCTMFWKWLKRSCLQCTLQAAHFSLAFSLLPLKFMPITWKALSSPTIAFFSLSVLKIDMTDHVSKGHANSIKAGQKAVSIDRKLQVKYQTFLSLSSDTVRAWYWIRYSVYWSTWLLLVCDGFSALHLRKCGLVCSI